MSHHMCSPFLSVSIFLNRKRGHQPAFPINCFDLCYFLFGTVFFCFLSTHSGCEHHMAVMLTVLTVGPSCVPALEWSMHCHLLLLSVTRNTAVHWFRVLYSLYGRLLFSCFFFNLPVGNESIEHIIILCKCH